MIRHGEAPYLECSTRGDRRFSAYCARVIGQAIEAQYQAYKIIYIGGFPRSGLSIKEAKGRPAANAGQAALYYAKLWDQYIAEHPELLPILRAASGLSDMFGQEGHVCQATELWRIRNAP